MAWSRTGKKYIVNRVASTDISPGIMIQWLWIDSFFDFSTRKFVTTQPVQLIQPLVLQEKPIVVGVNQRWSYALTTTDLPDGEYCIYHTNSGQLTTDVACDYFSVFQGSTIGIVPNPLMGTT